MIYVCYQKNILDYKQELKNILKEGVQDEK